MMTFLYIHRFMHPWWSVQNGLRQSDIGAFLYRHVHSFHHEVVILVHGLDYYYTSAYIPLLFTCHPIHFLYNLQNFIWILH